jgi:UDP-N-acetylmuramoyl-tripeptide--D-alanyl-D-alanine ligase
VLGDMAELGADARALHAGIGSARAKRVERLFAVGPLNAATVEAFGAQGEHFADKAALIAALKTQLHERRDLPDQGLALGGHGTGRCRAGRSR